MQTRLSLFFLKRFLWIHIGMLITFQVIGFNLFNVSSAQCEGSFLSHMFAIIDLEKDPNHLDKSPIEIFYTATADPVVLTTTSTADPVVLTTTSTADPVVTTTSSVSNWYLPYEKQVELRETLQRSSNLEALTIGEIKKLSPWITFTDHTTSNYNMYLRLVRIHNEAEIIVNAYHTAILNDTSITSSRQLMLAALDTFPVVENTFFFTDTTLINSMRNYELLMAQFLQHYHQTPEIRGSFLDFIATYELYCSYALDGGSTSNIRTAIHNIDHISYGNTLHSTTEYVRNYMENIEMNP